MLNSLERHILIDHVYSNHKNVYNEAVAVNLPCKISLLTLRTCLANVLNMYPILHSNYYLQEHQFVRHLGCHTSLICDELPNNEILNFIQKPFDLVNDKLIRFCLINNCEKQKLLIVFFHAIMDGASVIDILVPKILELLSIGNGVFIYTQEINQYYWFINQLGDIYNYEIEEKLEYWSKFFSQTANIFDIPNSHGSQTAAGNTVCFHTPLLDISNLMHSLSIGWFDVLLCAWFIILNKITSHQFIALRTNIDERKFIPKAKNTMGCLLNHLFIGASIDHNDTVHNLLVQTCNNKSTSIAHAVDYDFLLKNFRVQTATLSKIHFNIEPTSSYDVEHCGSLHRCVKNDLYVEVELRGNTIVGCIEYASDIFTDGFIKNMATDYVACLGNMTTIDAHTTIKELHLMNHWHVSAYMPQKQRINPTATIPQQIQTIQANQTLYRLYAQTLVIPLHNLKPSDNFINLGGNSLLAMSFATLLKNEFGIEPTYHQICQYSIQEIHTLVNKHSNY